MSNHASKRKGGGRKASTTNLEIVLPDGERWQDVVLVRISLDRANETSTETQTDECHAFSAMFNGDVVHTEIERGQSAYKQGMHRAGLERVLRMLESGRANRLVVWKLDRLMRDVHDFSLVLNRLKAAGVHLVSRTEPWVDTTSPMGYAIVHIIAAAAEIESMNKSDRQWSFLAGRIKGTGTDAPNPLTPPGRAPFGYTRTGPNALVINPEEQAELHNIARAILAGSSLRSICEDMNNRGVTTHGGARWNHTALRKAITTPTIIAHAAWEGELHESTNWQPCISIGEWEAVRMVLDDPDRDVNRGALKGTPMVVKHMLSGVIRCGVDGCDGVLRPTGVNNRLKCTGTDCRASIYEDAAEEYVTACLFSMVTEDDWTMMQARGMSASRSALDKLTAKAERARKMWLADAMTDAEFDAIQRDIAELSASVETSESLDLPDWASLWDGWQTASAAERRTVITTVFESITCVPRSKGCNGTERIKLMPRDLEATTEAAA